MALTHHKIMIPVRNQRGLNNLSRILVRGSKRA